MRLLPTISRISLALLFVLVTAWAAHAQVPAQIEFESVPITGGGGGGGSGGGGPAVSIMGPPYNAACDGVTDDTVAFALATTTGGSFYIPSGSAAHPRVCVVSLFAPGPAGGSGVSQVWDGGTRSYTTLRVTGNGGNVACSEGAGGAIQIMNVLDVQIKNLTLQSTGTWTVPGGCFINIGNQPVNAREYLTNDVIQGTQSPSANSIIGVLGDGGVDQLVMDNVFIGSQITGFAQSVVMLNADNNSVFNQLTIEPNANNLASGITFDALPAIDFNGAGGQISNPQCIKVVNCIKVENGTQGWIDNLYVANITATVNSWWLPGLTLARGDYIFAPAVQITGTCSNTTNTITSVSSAAGLYINEPLTLIGCGTAGANLVTRISLCTLAAGSTTACAASDTTFNVNSGQAPATNQTGTSIDLPAYAGHCYRAVVAGTTGNSPPAFPVTPEGQVTDGTATIQEYGTCAAVTDTSTEPVFYASSQPFKAMLAFASLAGTVPYINTLQLTGHNSMGVFLDNTAGGTIESIGAVGSAQVDIAGIMVRGSSAGSQNIIIQGNHITRTVNRPNPIDLGSNTAGTVTTENPLEISGVGAGNWTQVTQTAGVPPQYNVMNATVNGQQNLATVGALGDAEQVSTGAITNTQTLLTIGGGGALFNAATDVGKPIMVMGAGGSATTPLNTTISSVVSTTQVNLTVSATSTVSSGGLVIWGTDNGPEIREAIANLPATGGIIDARPVTNFFTGGIGGPMVISSAITGINKPITLISNNPIIYIGAQQTNGIFQFLAGSDGSKITCDTIAGRPSTSTGIPTVWQAYYAAYPPALTPMFTFDRVAHSHELDSVQVYGCGFAGTSLVSDVFQFAQAAGDQVTVDHVSETAAIASTEGPSGYFVNWPGAFVSVGEQNNEILQNSYFFNSGGVLNIATSQNVAYRIDNNLVINMAGVTNASSYNAIFQIGQPANAPNGQAYNTYFNSNVLQDSVLPNSGKVIDAESGFVSYHNNHFENNNILGSTGVVDIYENSNTFVATNNSISGGTIAAADAPQYGIQATNSIFGGFIAGNFSGNYTSCSYKTSQNDNNIYIGVNDFSGTVIKNSIEKCDATHSGDYGYAASGARRTDTLGVSGYTDAGGIYVDGSLRTGLVGTPNAPTVTPLTTGATTATYYCISLDTSGNATNVSTGTTITNGNATPNTLVTCNTIGSASYQILKNSNTTGATCLLGTATPSSNNVGTITDSGQSLTPCTVNATDQTGKLELGTDNNVSTMAREPWAFPMALTSAVTGTNLACHQLVKADTIENYVGSWYVGASCSNPVVRLYDCGSSAPTNANCSGGTQLATDTLSNTAGTVVAGTINSANVAAGEYVCTQLQAAGSCTTLYGTMTARVRPQ